MKIARVVLAAAALAIAAPAFAGDHPFRAAAREFDITPHVKTWDDADGNGKFDPGGAGAPFNLGERVTSFEEGTIYVGNGRGEAHYIQGPLKTSVLVVDDARRKTRVAYVSTDLYLILGPDADAIRDLVGVSAAVDHIVIAPTHNHMGPDTLGLTGLESEGAGGVLGIVYNPRRHAKSGVNGVWFEDVMRRTAIAIEQAAFTLEPAAIRVARTKFSFGMTDQREPLIVDDDLMVLGVDNWDGEPIATVVQGNCHPESVLQYAHDLYGIGAVNLTDAAREAWGHIISPGFPGAVRRTIREKNGGVPLYFSGALGGMVTNLQQRIWDPEIEPVIPVDADPATVPEDRLIPNDFRYMEVQGREMAKAAMAALASQSETVREPEVSFAKKDILVPLQNPLFRLASAMGILGHTPGMLYHDDGQPDRDVGRCVKGLCVTGLWIPKGRNLKTEVSVVNVGPAQFINAPAELLGELTAGFPEGFHTNVPKYFPHESKRPSDRQRLRASLSAPQTAGDAALSLHHRARQQRSRLRDPGVGFQSAERSVVLSAVYVVVDLLRCQRAPSLRGKQYGQPQDRGTRHGRPHRTPSKRRNPIRRPDPARAPTTAATPRSFRRTTSSRTGADESGRTPRRDPRRARYGHRKSHALVIRVRAFVVLRRAGAQDERREF
ncbi:MAG: hypothetical protein M5R36_17040 [Deltaproteobacteria bacterium]|nr:hypothetical protein [Deltaproteobacteria bacterium]